MPPIRNSCVARGVVNTGTNAPVFIVPDATVLLLKNMVFGTASGVTDSFRVGVTNATQSAGVVVFRGSATPTQEAIFSGWLAMNAGDVLAVTNQQPGLYYWISGALLPQIPGF